MNRRTVLASTLASPLALLATERPTEASAITPAPLDFVEWLLLHPGARELEGAPGWVFKHDGPEETGAPHWKLHVRNRDGREFDYLIGMWTMESGAVRPMTTSFDHMLLDELHRRYPDEYPEAPSYFALDWAPGIHLNAAFDALLHDDVEVFERHMYAAKRALGR